MSLTQMSEMYYIFFARGPFDIKRIPSLDHADLSPQDILYQRKEKTLPSRIPLGISF